VKNNLAKKANKMYTFGHVFEFYSKVCLQLTPHAAIGVLDKWFSFTEILDLRKMTGVLRLAVP